MIFNAGLFAQHTTMFGFCLHCVLLRVSKDKLIDAMDWATGTAPLISTASERCSNKPLYIHQQFPDAALDHTDGNEEVLDIPLVMAEGN
jgi:hypothetical protein